MRVVRVVPDVAGQRDVRFPAPRGRIGQFARIETVQFRQRTRRALVGRAVAFFPRRDVAGFEAGAGGQGRIVEAGAARRLAQDVGEVVFEHGGVLF